MADLFWIVGAFVVSGAGFSLLALRQNRHFVAGSASAKTAVPPDSLRTKWAWLGGGGVVGGFALSWMAMGPSFGSLLGVFVAATASTAVTLILAFRPRYLSVFLVSIKPESRK